MNRPYYALMGFLGNTCPYSLYPTIQTVGTLSTTSQVKPFYGLYKNSMSACIYSLSAFSYTSCKINSVQIKFNSFTTPYTVSNQEIWIGEISDSTFPSSTPQVNFSDLTFVKPLVKVKNAFTCTISANGVWKTFTFDTPYCYNGTGNILFVWKNYNGAWASGYGNADVANVVSKAMYKGDDAGYPTGTGTRDNYPLLLKFNININTFPAWDNLTNYYAGENNANDKKGTSNGTIVGTVGYTTGVNGNCFSFSAVTNSYVSFPTDFFKPAGSFSYSCWFKTSDTGTDTIYTQTASNGYLGFRVYLGGTSRNINFSKFPSGTTINTLSSGGAVYTSGAWNFLTVVNDTTVGMLIYCNGLLLTSNVTTSAVSWGSTTINRLGCNYDGNTPFNGQIDEVGFYNGVISLQQHIDMYNSGSGIFY